jgi:hypothetical protein
VSGPYFSLKAVTGWRPEARLIVVEALNGGGHMRRRKRQAVCFRFAYF